MLSNKQKRAVGSGRGADNVKFVEIEREPGNHVREAEGEGDFKV